MVIRGVAQPELREDARDVALDRGDRYAEHLGDSAIGAPRGHQLENLSLAGAQPMERAAPVAVPDEHRDHLRIEHGAAAGDSPDRLDKGAHVPNAILEQVANSFGAIPEQFECIATLEELRQHEDADLRLARTDLARR